jgi:hypothetical protein
VIPSSYQSIPEWQRLVATNVNPILTEYIIDSAKLTYSGNAHKLLRINSTADGVELSSDLDSVTLSHGGTQVAATATTGIDLSTGKVLSVNGTQVVAARLTGWSADTGTNKRTANATYTAATISNPPTQTEVQDIANALQDVSRTMKALKADLTSHGLIGT